MPRLLFVLLSIFSLSTFAAPDRADYDLDDNGLIEINSLEDLHAIRNALDGATLYGENTGCPDGGCIGFELTTDLDFDTSGDGVLDESDSYWNDGQGWEPIGTYYNRFTGLFEGNGHEIRNLMINRPSSDYQGLFAATEGAEIRNLGLSGSLMAIEGSHYVGALAGRVEGGGIIASFASGSVKSHSGLSYTGGLVGLLEDSAITASYTAGSVSATGRYVGGLVGYARDSSLKAVFSTVAVTGGSYVGGVVGSLTSASSIERSFATGYVSGTSSVGGLAGSSLSSTTRDSYWATDASGQSGSRGGTGALLRELRCPTAADDSTCAETDLFVGWADSIDAAGNPYWVFGEDNQLPGLSLNGVVHHDSDGDGAMDVDDDFPFNYAVSLDSDGDGAVDFWTPGCDVDCQQASGLVLDLLPHDPAARIDQDLDGYPDEWNEGCDSVCQGASALTLDPYPNDVDNDGIPDHEDDDTHGVRNADIGSNGLITISTLEQLNAIRYNLAGTGLRMSPDDEVDASGCPVQSINGIPQRACWGYELAEDLNFDTNGDGVLDANDRYWSDEEGWVPLGSYSEPFAGIFDGNGHEIRNLTINRPSSAYQGFFGFTEGAEIRNLGLTGPLMSVEGSHYVGALAGRVEGGVITASYATGAVKSHRTSYPAYTGGLVGSLSDSAITASYTTGSVSATGDRVGGLVGYAIGSSLEAVFSAAAATGGSYVGGLVGTQGDGSSIERSFTTGFVSGKNYVGGLTGSRFSSTTVSDSYWATDASGQADSSGGTGALLSELRCATAADDSACAETDLFVGWADSVDAAGNPNWVFGEDNQLPGLSLNGVVHHDSDGDGAMDVDDDFPFNYAVSLDSDGDGAVDFWTPGCDVDCQQASGLVLDQFPQDPAASIDRDLDGYPDEWNEGCDSACQEASALTLDSYPEDSDNDGIPDHEDDDTDGVRNADIGSNGLITISTLEQLNAIRYNLAGTGLQMSPDDEPDASGCPIRTVDGVLQRACWGYELAADLDFDTNGDGVLDENDRYWNDGEGWEPIGSESEPFAVIFDGNGHEVRNLMINRPSSDYQGLFGATEGAEIRNLGLTGLLLSVEGGRYVGALAGRVEGGAITASFATGPVKSHSTYTDAYTGGLVGRLSNSAITASYTAGSVSATGRYVGGLVGYSRDGSLEAVFSTAAVTGRSDVGGLVGEQMSASIKRSFSTGFVSGLTGYSSGSSTVSDSYWAADVSGQARSSGAIGALLRELRCSTAADDSACADMDLFVGWADSVDEAGNPYWVFGEDNQLPGLSLNGVVHHDSDGDGTMDEDDDFPFDYAAFLDSDGDGALDFWTRDCEVDCQQASDLVLDQFPLDPATSIDRDLDGSPDEWNEGCDSSCQEASDLTLDPYPNDVDNDGIPDHEDDDTHDVRNADIGSNGLITISTLEQLNAIRYNLAGTGLKMSPDDEPDASGCPARAVDGVLQRACWGYELAADLDFDTNGDGVLDENDRYWNDGEGWEPIGTRSDSFTGVFEGNGHEVRNLMINRPLSDYLGLFGTTEGAEIRNLGLTGALMSVEGNSSVGALAGRTWGGAISASYSAGSVSAAGDSVGGLVGFVGHSSLEAVFSTASVTGDSNVGGLVGYQTGTSTIERSFATGFVSGTSSVGGLVGFRFESTIRESYWATDASGQADSSGGTGALLSELRCATAADDSACAGTDLFVGWADSVDAAGNPYWVFGEDNQLPGLAFNGVVHRDSDGDGKMGESDEFPLNFAASVDSDGDGAVDFWTLGCDVDCQQASGLVLDQFLQDPAASIDSDLDGMPDQWNEGCDSACQEASNLTLDPYPNDVDNDGIPDHEDEYTDGVRNADIGSNGLITISTLEQLNAIRHNLAGTGLQMSSDDEPDASGCPAHIVEGVLQRVCWGYELAADLDFDTNGDGVLDENDRYWNDGEGWEPIGSESEPFTGTFEGNGFEVRNLMINRPSFDDQGMFGATERAEIRNLGLTGPLMSVEGSEYVGALAGRVYGGLITASYATGAVKSHSTAYSADTGGLVGFLEDGAITASFTAGSVSATGRYVGGLVGFARSSSLEAVFSTAAVIGGAEVGGLVGVLVDASLVERSFATGRVLGTSRVGGLTGYSGSSSISESYWATDASGQSSSEGGTGVVLNELYCPTAADDSACAETNLFVGWADSVDAAGNPYWNFGTGIQLPGLMIHGVVHRDTDGDGLMDRDDPDIDGDGTPNEEDVSPYSYAASVDSDNDGSPDAWNDACDAVCQAASRLRLDDFPENRAASLDSDGDGYPDEWSEGCDASCQAASNMRLDDFPDNPAASLDSSGDGQPDEWNEGCDLVCQEESGLTLSPDTESPVIIAVPQDMHVTASGETTRVTLHVADIIADDNRDTELAYEVFLEDEALVLNDDDQVSLPSGALQLHWVAVDQSGNRSEPVAQYVNVYPQVRFTQSEQITGNPSRPHLEVSLSGPSPVYPIEVLFSWVEYDSTVTREDIDSDSEAGVDLDHLSIIIESEEALEDAGLIIPILDRDVFASDQQLIIEILSAKAGEEDSQEEDIRFAMPIDESGKRLELTVTDLNLPPEAKLSMSQGGEETSVLDPEGEEVTVTAVVTDPNGNDEHSFDWFGPDLPVTLHDQASFTFDPSSMVQGIYTLSVVVTDDGNPLLSTETISYEFEVQRADVDESSSSSSSSADSSSSVDSSSSADSSASSSNSSSSGSSGPETGGGGKAGAGGSSGGGSMSALTLLLLMLSAAGTCVRRRSNGGGRSAALTVQGAQDVLFYRGGR